jgi:hypothetical protein
MTDEDIYAFRPVPEGAPPPGPAPAARTPRRVWPWVVGLMALLALAFAGAAMVALLALGDAAHHGLHITLNGDAWDPAVVDADHWGLALLGVAGAMLAVLVVVPLALLLGLLSAALGIGIALLVVLLVAAVVLSPLWVLVLLLWLLLRPRPAPAATMRA